MELPNKASDSSLLFGNDCRFFGWANELD